MKASIITPSFLGDLERFLMLRESYERFSIEIPHLAVVNHEDLQAFQQIPFRRGLTILSARDVLPESLEAWRLSPDISEREKRHRGWHCQQIIKLYMAHMVDSECLVCLDSDAFFVDSLSPDHFRGEGGDLLLYEVDTGYVWPHGEWWFDCHRFLGIEPDVTSPHSYVYMMVPLSRTIVIEMCRYIEQRFNKPWYESMTEAQVTEYSTYGVFARGIMRYQSLHRVEPTDQIAWWPGSVEMNDDLFLARIRRERPKVASIQSSLGRPAADYRTLVEEAWTPAMAASSAPCSL